MENQIYEYTHQQAIEDGILGEVFKNRWNQLSNGKPILATSSILAEFSLAAIIEMWNSYAVNRQPGHIFCTKMNGENIWITFDGIVYTIMFPSDN